MKKTIFFGLISILVAISTFGQQARQLTVAVSPFEVRGGANQNDADTIYEIFVGELVTSGKVKVVDRTSFDAIMTEMKFQISDWSNGSKVAQLGRALNANSLIRGQLMYLGGQLIIMANILDINTAQILSSSRLQLNDILDALDQMPEFVNGMVAKLPGSSNSGTGLRQAQGGNTDASGLYGTWLWPKSLSGFDYDITVTIDANKITYRNLSGDYFVVINCTWTTENNSDYKTLADYSKGFKVSGMVTENKGYTPKRFMPLYLYIHKSDNTKLYLYDTPDSNSEVQEDGRGPFVKIQ